MKIRNIFILAFITCLFCHTCKTRYYDLEKEKCECGIYSKAIMYILFPSKKFPAYKVFKNNNNKIIIESSDLLLYKESIPKNLYEVWKIYPPFNAWQKKTQANGVNFENFKNNKQITIFKCFEYLNKTKEFENRVIFYKFNEKFDSFSEYIEFIQCCEYNSINFSNILFDELNNNAFLTAHWKFDNGGDVYFYFVFSKKQNEWKLKYFFATP